VLAKGLLYSEIMAVCSEIHATRINTLRGQKLEFMNAKPGVTGLYRIKEGI
jgi:hypothetical protein